jgi:hypothetical protein
MSSNHTPNQDGYVLVPVRKMKMSRLRKGLVGVVALGAAAAISAGTFASFSATTTNANNVFSTGQIELGNTKQSGTQCLSGYTGPGTGSPQADLDDNDNATCDSLISLTLRKPGDTANGRVSLANTGDYNGLLKFWLNGCTDGTVATPAGSGELCDKLEVYVQEYNAAFDTPTATCVFPESAVAACNSSWSASDDSIDDLAAFATSAAPAPTAGIALNTSVTKHYQVSVRFANGGFDGNGNGVDNLYQNRSINFAMTWRLQEA